MTLHGLGMAHAADVAVEANHAVRGRHHQMQIVRHHQYPQIAALAQVPDEIVDLALAGDVDALHRLVEHQEIGLAQERPGQQHAAQLAP